MKYILITMMAALLLSANALAAIKIDARQARNMDDVQSLGVIYINHKPTRRLASRAMLRERSTSSRSSFMNREATAPFTPVPPFTASFPGSLASSRCRGKPTMALPGGHTRTIAP